MPIIDKKILFVTSSTAGHVWPAVNIANQVRKSSNTQVYFYTSGSEIETKILDEQKLTHRRIMSGKWRRYFSLLNILDVFKVVGGTLQVFSIFLISRPDVIFIKGGFVGVPVGIAATVLGIPYYIHESDSKMGLANRILAKHAQKILVAFPLEVYKNDYFVKKMQSVGIPLSDEFTTDITHTDVAVKTVLFFGGSLGSSSINSVVTSILEPLLRDGYKVHHICGNSAIKDFQALRDSLDKTLAENYYPYGFVSTGIATIMKSADIVISRAGATTLFELSALSKPAILIPLSMAGSRGDQIHNAQYMKSNNAAVVVTEGELDSKSLVNTIKSVINDPARAKTLSNNISKLLQKGSSELIAQDLIKSIQ
jgi:UDP-N-acetylglucosamine--N-acetylmuramyl-(pentapeptide) pyrophosphoryl-undecaprenol N-acetylglucosamine transferase